MSNRKEKVSVLFSLLLIIGMLWSCSGGTNFKSRTYINYGKQLVTSIVIDTVTNKELVSILPQQNYKIYDRWIIINQGNDSNAFQLDSPAYIIRGKINTIILIQSEDENYNIFYSIRNNQVFYDSYMHSDSLHVLSVDNHILIESFVWNKGAKIELIKPCLNKNEYTYVSIPNEKDKHIGYEIEVKNYTILYKEIK